MRRLRDIFLDTLFDVKDSYDYLRSAIHGVLKEFYPALHTQVIKTSTRPGEITNHYSCSCKWGPEGSWTITGLNEKTKP
jgi:hypothetical protein